MNNFFKEKFNVKYPIIQGGMANIATPEFAAEVSKAGAIGLIGTGGWTFEQSKIEIDKMDYLLDGEVYGVNVMLMNPYAEQIIDYAIEKKVQLITTGAGDPNKYIKRIHDANLTIIPVIANVFLAKKMEKSGVDAVIVEGTESGGHVGEMTTLTIVPQVIKSLNIPVIAAGGIASPEQLLAVYALGACGAQIGTSLLVSKECPIHENYKQLILKAKDNSTVVTGRSKGVPVRAIKNKLTRQYTKIENSTDDMLELEKMTLGSLKKAVFDGNIEEGSFMAGQVVGQLSEVKSVHEIISEICNTEDALKKLLMKVENYEDQK